MSFPAKIFFFGEYSVLSGSKALALPFFKYFGKSRYEKNNNYNLIGLYHYLSAVNSQQEFLNLEKLKDSIDKGWSFDSNIPEGKGLGSSGAFCASLYDEFKLNDQGNIKHHLSLIESYFHGTSSGVDPYVSYTKSSLLFENLSDYKLIHDDSFLDDFFSNNFLYLLDTGIKREGSAFIKIYNDKTKDSNFSDFIFNDYNLICDKIIDDFTDGKSIFENLALLSSYQVQYFKEMFPSTVLDLQKSFSHNNAYIKLCGAGGGGFYLVFSQHELLSEKLNLIKLSKEDFRDSSRHQ